MKQRIKKSCSGCKAASATITSFGVYPTCSLGYAQSVGIPREVCPKPVTIVKYLEEHYKRVNG